MPPRTRQAAPSPNSGSQSESLRQSRQCPAGPPLKAAQKPAFPVVSVQKQLGLLGLQGTSTPVVQESASAMQMPALCATHLLLSFLPFFGFFPWQMPEQHAPFLPRQASPTSTQPKAFFGFFAFLPLPLLFLAMGLDRASRPSDP